MSLVQALLLSGLLLSSATPSSDPRDRQAPTPFERADVTAVAERIACYCGCPHMQVSTCFCGTADSIRADIAAHLDAGLSAEDFVAAYVVEHGTWGLAVPPKEGFNLVVWALPGILIVGGAVLVFLLGAAWTGRPTEGERAVLSREDASSPERDELERLVREGE